MADFYPPQRKTNHVAGFRYTRTDALDFGHAIQTQIEVLHAPTEAIRLELQALQVDDDQIELKIDADSASIDEDLLTHLAEWLSELLTQLPQLLDMPSIQVVDTALAPILVTGRVHGPKQPHRTTIVRAFTEQVARNPDACAARDESATVSYRVLYEQMLAISSSLRSHEVKRGDRVAVCMRRGIPLLTAILGVMHRGATFVPVDQTLPIDRLTTILADATPRLVILDDRAARIMPALAAHNPVIFEELLQGIGDRERERVSETRPDVAAEDNVPSGGHAETIEIAYMIYTSGSTGQPKGVLVTHAALINYLAWASQRYASHAGTGTLVHSSISVDMTITSLLLPLLTGQCVTLLASDDPLDLANALRQLRGLSPLKLTPGGLQLLRQLLPGSVLTRAADHLVLGGEQLSTACLEGMHAPGLRVTNEYGPTEATVGCCAYTFTLGDTVQDPVPIGRPIWNTTIEIRTHDGRTALPGIAGELFVAGVGVARGYHRRDAETVERFLPDRSYRTGDLAMLGQNGIARMLGRIDEQVKIHGFRIEPAEVESALVKHPGIAAAAVVATGTPPVLHAFLVPQNPVDARDIVEQAEQHAAAQLPFYARPGRYHALPALPLTHTAKRDRNALLALANARSTTASRATARPEANAIGAGRTKTMGPGAPAIVTLWQHVLGRAPTGPDEDFFASGADSVQAVLLAAQAQRAGLSLTVRDILEARTLRRIAAAASVAVDCASPSPSGPVPLTAHQRGFFNRNPCSPDRWILHWITVAPDEIDLIRLNGALQHVLTEHPALRTQFLNDRGQWTARIADHIEIAVQHIDLTTAKSSDPTRDALQRCAATISLKSRVANLCLMTGPAPDSQHIVWTVHHLVCDIISLQLLTERLWHYYHYPTNRMLATTDDGYGAVLRREADRPATGFPTMIASGTHTLAGRLAVEPGLVKYLKRSQLPKASHTLAALAATLIRTLAEVRPDLPTVVCVERHGREHATPGLAMTVGWLTEFTTVFSSRDALGESALLVDLQLQLDATPPYNAPAAEAQGSGSREQLPAVALNYLGEVPQGSALAIERTHPTDPLFGLELVCWMCRDVLHLSWRYAPSFFPSTTAKRLTDVFTRHIATIAADESQHAATTLAHDVSDADLRRIAAAFEEKMT